MAVIDTEAYMKRWHKELNRVAEACQSVPAATPQAGDTPAIEVGSKWRCRNTGDTMTVTRVGSLITCQRDKDRRAADYFPKRFGTTLVPHVDEPKRDDYPPFEVGQLRLGPVSGRPFRVSYVSSDGCATVVSDSGHETRSSRPARWKLAPQQEPQADVTVPSDCLTTEQRQRIEETLRAYAMYGDPEAAERRRKQCEVPTTSAAALSRSKPKPKAPTRDELLAEWMRLRPDGLHESGWRRVGVSIIGEQDVNTPTLVRSNARTLAASIAIHNDPPRLYRDEVERCKPAKRWWAK